ncbi:undecaprenyl/decaprenyl-phosphate alpha-N-acetylglucosaminyl 1-phosphate transferase [Rummeliibacillus sp. TYF005]|uniref:glycosyltransferase family 4 protein n=1 Tax=unclassified Rummeliibacillus TaxID=2622809 RepID=UPI000E6637F1|nr:MULTISPECIES: MraY family glycosyltransferase [unclassified Rummeliibacillus]RIJ65038.1 undecaprenyl/decaprenyl-phosphate alpha-N-acetylglucosaminyl 1-phosphate transferase [Rummeliibacillus sp. POC4]RPJ96804.1 undecaprenyl/decaprenyl-phosphate alpha-N-acetylglucosaminyl 1-phosphate transferase [Rummeliibacillus sp. TYF005]
MNYLALVVAFVASILLTPLVKRLAFRIGAVDKPNYRKVHDHVMPRLGGLAIFLAFLIGIVVAQPMDKSMIAILIGGFVIIVTGVLDDMLEISPKAKLIGQTVAAAIVIFFGGVQIDFINLPFDGKLDFGYLSIPLTLIWIIGITNAINLIDGLDGLAAGVSTIALITLAAMAFIMGNVFVLVMALILAASTCGFLFYNFHPAKIFMGDTGALFLGFMISVLALLGFKNVTFVSLVVPIVMLGVPISDTFFAIVRRLLNKQPPFSPDKSHLHHRLMSIGFTHRQTVLLIYGIAAMFGLAAITFSMAKVWGAILLITVILVVIELFVEVIGLAGQNYRPLLNLVRKK